MAFAKKAESAFMAIQPLEFGYVKMYMLSTTPLYMNRMSKKAREQLLLPAPKTNQAARESVQKHNPPAEFNEAIYRCRDDKAPTLIHVPDGAIKGALANTALRIPGATKTEIGCLVRVMTPTVHLFGKPFLKMDIVRQGGINKTPDVRTRAFFPEWCCEVELRYMLKRIRESDLVNLLAAAGEINGIGDGRTEKGKFDFGSWELVAENDSRLLKIMKQQGRKVQTAAMDACEPYDEESEELLNWYKEEVVRREVEPRTKRKPRKDNGDAAVELQ